MELYPHNRKAYNALTAMLAEKDRACIIQPTGTGKFVIGAHFALEHPDKKILWLCPSEYIFMEQNANLKRIDPEASLDNVEQMTYAYAMNATKNKTLDVAADYIVLDEFHHIGAPEWSKGVEAVIHQCSNAKIIGMSATEIRHSDNGRNMADEFFEGNVASYMTLVEAWLRGILPIPTYVCALYEAPSELGDLLIKGEAIKDKKRYSNFVKKYEKLRRALAEADKIDAIFKQYLTKRDAKLIVFCRNKKHLEEVVLLRREWFKQVNSEIHFYKTYQANPTGEKEYNAFKEDSSNALKVLYCINQLNEGVHIDGIDGVVMVRPTQSPVIFNQQLGRALDVGKNNVPLVFDLVNNLSASGSYKTIRSSMESEYQIMKKRGEKPVRTPKDFEIHGDLKDVAELIEAARELVRPRRLTIDEQIAFLEELHAKGHRFEQS